jgi:hypothetical protein
MGNEENASAGVLDIRLPFYARTILRCCCHRIIWQSSGLMAFLLPIKLSSNAVATVGVHD